MRPTEPRIMPLEEQDWNDEQRRMLTESLISEKPINIFKTLARHPELLKRWLVFASHVLIESTLPPRERELVILRIGWLCRSEYEWAQHVVLGKRSGLTDEEIDRIYEGPETHGWSDLDRTLVRATDELHADACISDRTWAGLKKAYSDEQMMDLIFTVGNYNLVCMALNSLGVQIDPGLEGFKR
jgi:4-carboxymuconolactone decarboxylase